VPPRWQIAKKHRSRMGDAYVGETYYIVCKRLSHEAFFDNAVAIGKE
jgi:hypothetical protein